MRLPFSTFILSATALFPLLPSVVLAIHPHAFARREHAHSSEAHILSSRQHHIARDLLDVCVNTNVNLAANASQLLGLGSLLGDLGLGSNVQLCLCLKDLNLYLDTNDDVQVLVGLLGKNAVSTVITALINTSPNSRQCTFPSNSHHTCNNSDPCHYECDTNYVQNGDTCACAPPNISCNGVCGSFPQGCGSAVPSRKREEPAHTLFQAQARCKPHETVCGIPGQVGTLAFECVDVKTVKDSCGGCVLPHSFLDHSTQTPGKDCTSILNVKSSSCFESRCIVNSCGEGFVPSPTKDSCLPSSGSLKRMRRVRKRAGLSSDNISVTANVNSDLLTQLLAISNAVVDLSSLASSSSGFSSASASPATSSIYALFNDIVRGTGQLLTSATVSDLVSNTANLLDTCSLLSSMLYSCGCAQALGLVDSAAELQSLITAISALKTWCQDNPVAVGLPLPTPTAYTPSLPSTSVATSATSTSGNEGDTPIVIGLSDLLSGLQLLGSVKSNVTVGGLGSGMSETVNDLLNGLDIGPGNAKRRDVSDAVNSTISSELRSQLEGLVDLVLALEDSMSSLPSHDPESSTSSLDDQSVLGVAYAMGQLLQSQTTAALLTNVEDFIDAASLLQEDFTACACTQALGLDQAVKFLGLITDAAVALKSWCASNSIVAPTPADPTTTSLGTLLPTGGPVARASPQAPPAHVSTPIINSRDTPIIVGLDNLLDGLGLQGSTGIATVDGLGDGLDTSVNNLLDTLAGIGPGGVRRRQDLMRANEGVLPHVIYNKRQIASTANLTIDSTLLTQIDGLVDLVLGLNSLASSLPSSSASASPTISATIQPHATPASSGPDTTSVSSVLFPTPTGPSSTSDIDSHLVDEIFQLTIALLSCQTYEDLVSESEALVSLSITSLEALEACNCTQVLGLGGVYDYFVKILDASLNLQGLLQDYSTLPGVPSSAIPTGAPPASMGSSAAISGATDSGREPLVVGLTKLLHGLGLNITANTVVDGLLGDGLDHSLNSALMA